MNRALLACLLGLGGCAAGAGERQEQTWRFAMAHRDCAPWDGAATTVVLSDTRIDQEPTRPFLRISAWVPLPDREVRADLEDRGPGGGAASYCETEGDCVLATRGWVRLGPVRDSLQGEYELTLRDGRTIGGRFVAPVRTEIRMLCG